MSDFGLKLGIEGEKEFKQAIRDINSSFKVLGSEMTLVASKFDKQDNSVEAVTARNKVLGKELEEQKSKISTLARALDNASESFGENDKRTLAWKVQLNKALAELNDMRRELKQNSEALDDTADGYDDAEKQADQFGDEVKKAGNEAKDSGGKLEKLGSIAKGVGKAMTVSFAAIGTATIAAGKALVDATTDAATYADEMLTTSTVTGMSTESLQAYSYAADLIDTNLETVTKSMGKNIKSMASAKDGSKAYAEAYEKLGVSVTDTHGKLRDGESVYWECIDALGNVKNETERDAIAFQLFGKSAQELNPLISQGSSGFAALTEEAKSMGAVMSDDQLKSLGGFDDSIQRLKSTAAGAKNAIGTVLVPELKAITDDGVSLLGEFSKGIIAADGDWGKIGETVGSAITGIFGKLKDFMPHMSELAIGIVLALVTGITENIGSIAESASQILTTLVAALSETLPELSSSAVTLVLTLVEAILQNLPMLIEAALQVVITLANGIAEALPELIPQIVETVITIVNTLIENIPMLIEAALNIILALAEGIGEAIPELVKAIPQILSAIVTAIIASLPQLLPAAIDIIFALVDGILGALPELIAAVPNLIMGIVQGILDNLPTLILYAPEIITSLITGLIGAIPDLVLALPKVIMSIVDTFRKYDWGSVGTNLIEGLITGLSGMIEKVRNKIREIGQDMVKAFKSFFGINSPSTVFAGFGRNLLEGLWNGISDIKEWLVEKIRSLGGIITDALKTVLGINSPSKVFEDEIGVNLGLGVGVGFEKSMKQVAVDMQKSIPTDFDIDANVKAAVSTPTKGFGGFSLTLTIENFYNNSLQDIRQLAEEISTVLASEVSRKAEAF